MIAKRVSSPEGALVAWRTNCGGLSHPAYATSSWRLLISNATRPRTAGVSTRLEHLPKRVSNSGQKAFLASPRVSHFLDDCLMRHRQKILSATLLSHRSEIARPHFISRAHVLLIFPPLADYSSSIIFQLYHSRYQTFRPQQPTLATLPLLIFKSHLFQHKEDSTDVRRSRQPTEYSECPRSEPFSRRLETSNGRPLDPFLPSFGWTARC
jgi:hypothetical protein